MTGYRDKMSKVNDQDWELLNAYHDGMLAADAQEALEARLAGEPALQHGLAQIKRLSAGLRRLHPAAGQPVVIARPRKRRYFGALALAASVAAAVIITGAFYNRQVAHPQSPAAWHAAFVAQGYQVSDSGRAQPAGLFGTKGVPDLSAANLTLVDLRSDETGAMALHYAGLNGCRLTLTAGYDAAQLAEAAPEALMRSAWITDAIEYVVLANGMDVSRFEAVSYFIRQQTERASRPETLLAMQLATDQATPCTPKA